MKDKVRWAILGAGRIAHTFAKDIQVVKNAALTAVASRDKNKAQHFSDEYSLPLVYSYDELYNSKEVDAVYVATTHNFHYEQCKQCLQHGKHVLCEKPVTINDTQFKELATLAKEKQVFFMEAMWTYFLPAVIKAKQWVDEGRIGDLKVIEAGFGYLMDKNPEGRLYNINLAGGALLDLGVYNVAFATYFTGKKPGSITASGVLTATGVDERTGIVLQYGDTTAWLFTTMVTIMNNKAVLYGDKAHIELENFSKASSACLFDNENKLIERFDDNRTTKGFNYQIQHATDKILEGKTESDVMTHNHSNIIQEIMTEVRRQIGLKYPEE